MITLLTGENSFEIEQALADIVKAFSGDIERYDGEQLQKNQLIDILSSISLFSLARLVVIRGLSANNAVWSNLDDILKRMCDDVELVLIEPKPDKRTVAYKNLTKIAKVKEFTLWSDRDEAKASTWVTNEAKKQGLRLDKKSVQTLVSRVGVDQWALYGAIQKLALLDEVTPQVIEDVIEANPQENVFNLLELAINGRTKELQSTLKNLEKTEDPFRLIALLSSQVFQLAAVSAAGEGDNVAKDFGIHPYVVSRLKTIAKKISKSDVSNIVNNFALLDEQLKTSAAEPWLLIESALIRLTS